MQQYFLSGIVSWWIPGTIWAKPIPSSKGFGTWTGEEEKMSEGQRKKEERKRERGREEGKKRQDMREGERRRQKRDPDMERNGSREKFVFNASSTALCTSVSIMPSVPRSRDTFCRKSEE